MHLTDDLVVVEPVDVDGHPVPPGVESAKVYVTSLFNPVLPIIRYEITDQVTVIDEPCRCGSQHRPIADIQGRLDDRFTYPGGVVVHPHVFRSVLARQPRVTEYQVTQTYRGADVLVRVSGPLDTDGRTHVLSASLRLAGRSASVVTVRAVDHIPRGAAGKLKRFITLEGAGPPPL